MYLTEKVRIIEPYEINDLKNMNGKYGEFRKLQYRIPKDRNDRIELLFGYSPIDRIDIRVTVTVVSDTLNVAVRILNGSKVLYERSSKELSLNRYGVLHVVIRVFLRNLCELLERVYSDSYFMCHTSTGNSPMYSDYWKLINEDYLDKQVNRLKGSISRLNKYIDQF